MVGNLRRRLSRMRDHMLAYLERRRLAIVVPPAMHSKVEEERIKSRVGLLNALGLGLFAGGVINPALTATEAAPVWVRIAAAVSSSVLIMAGQRYLRYIPNPNAPKETDHV